MSLPVRTQTQVSKALEIFDLRQNVAQTSSQLGLAYGSFQTFYDDFDVAFTQIFSYPDSVGTTTIRLADAIGNYADSVGVSYARANTAPQADLGQVLGAFISTHETQAVVNQVQTTTPKYFQKEYYYHAPSILKMGQ